MTLEEGFSYYLAKWCNHEKFNVKTVYRIKNNNNESELTQFETFVHFQIVEKLKQIKKKTTESMGPRLPEKAH